MGTIQWGIIAIASMILIVIISKYIISTYFNEKTKHVQKLLSIMNIEKKKRKENTNGTKL